MNLKKMKLLIIILGMTTILFGCRKQEAVKVEEVIKPVSIMEVETMTYSNDIEISGNIKPAQLIKRGFKVPGVIENVNIQEGDIVSQGQVLMTLNSHEYQLGVIAAQSQYDSINMELNSKINSAINKAQGNVEFINIQLDRVKRLHEKGAVSTRTVEELELRLLVGENELQEAKNAKDTSVSQLRQLQAALDLAQSQLSDTVLTSPINATIVKQVSEMGETTAPGYPVLVLGQLDTLEVEVGIPDRLIEYIDKGQEVKVFVHGPEKEMKGIVTSIDTTADLQTRTFGVKIEINNSENHIKPGMIANVIIPQKEITSIMLPIDTVTDDIEGGFVFLYNEESGTVEKRMVKVGEIYEDRIQILEGLENGELLVFKGQYGLLDGERVKAKGVKADD